MRMMTSVVRLSHLADQLPLVAAITLDPQPWRSSRWERTKPTRQQLPPTHQIRVSANPAHAQPYASALGGDLLSTVEAATESAS